MFLNVLTSMSNNSTITYIIQGLRQMPPSLSNISRLIPPTRDPRSKCFCWFRPLSDSWSKLCTMCLSPRDHEQQGGSHSPPTTTLTDLPEVLPTLFPWLITRQEKLMLLFEAASSSTPWIPSIIFPRILFPSSFISHPTVSILHSSHLTCYKNTQQLFCDPCDLHPQVDFLFFVTFKRSFCMLSSLLYITF